MDGDELTIYDLSKFVASNEFEDKGLGACNGCALG